MVVFGSGNKCTIDQLSDLLQRRQELVLDLHSLASSQDIPPSEFLGRAKQLAQEYMRVSEEIKRCTRSLEDPVKSAEELLKKFNVV